LLPSQRHIIKQQVLEIICQDEETGRRLQEKGRQLLLGKLTAILDRVLSRWAADGSLYRIGRLELDLGKLPIEAFEDTLVEKFENELERQLQQAVAQTAGSRQAAAKRVPAVERQWELFWQVLKEGVLPWWAPAGTPALWADCVSELWRQQPRRLLAAVRSMLKRPLWLRRFISHTPSNILLEMGTSLAKSPEMKQLLVQLPQLLPAILAQLNVKGLTPGRQKRLLWEGIWLQLMEPGMQQPTSLLKTVLMQFAAHAGLSWPEAAARLWGYAASPDLPPEMKQILAFLHTEDSPPYISSLLERLENLRAGQAEFGRYVQQLQALLRAGKASALSLKEREEVRRVFLAALEFAGAKGLQEQMGEHRLKKWWTALHETAPQSPAFDHLLAELGEWDAEPIWAAEGLQKPPVLSVQEGETAPPDAFAATEDVNVANAGLVLLWPFLPRFFEQTGIWDGVQYADDASPQRGVALLHYLASGQLFFPEFLLPINKILCGLSLEQPFDSDIALTEAEIKEADQLLEAVLLHAALPGKLSVEGLRHTFLQRAGILRAREAYWQLLIEKEGQDVLLTKISWSLQVVKLPWMQAPLYVSW